MKPSVSPDWVIFSTGHSFGHPWSVAAQCYIDNGVNLDKIFRTDLGDDETRPTDPDHKGNREWAHGRIIGHHDKAGDDDVDILLRPTGEIIVEYRENH